MSLIGLARAIRWVVLACLLAAPLGAAGESTGTAGRGNYFTIKPWGSVDYLVSDRPVIIAAQVRRAHQQEITASRMLAQSADFDSLTPIQDVVHDGYVLLRTATHGIERTLANTKYPNPVLKMRIEKIMEVRHHILLSLNGMQNAQKWQDPSFAAEATENLDTAITLLEALMPKML
jgi:hypothetical protein